MNKNYRTENKYKTNMGSKKRTVNSMYGREEAQKGGLKKVDKKKNPGLAKLPEKVRNKMGYMAKGGKVSKYKMKKKKGKK